MSVIMPHCDPTYSSALEHPMPRNDRMLESTLQGNNQNPLHYNVWKKQEQNPKTPTECNK